MDLTTFNYPLIVYLMLHFLIIGIMLIGWISARNKLSERLSTGTKDFMWIHRAEVILGRTKATFMITLIGEIVSNAFLWWAGIFDLLII